MCGLLFIFLINDDAENLLISLLSFHRACVVMCPSVLLIYYDWFLSSCHCVVRVNKVFFVYSGYKIGQMNSWTDGLAIFLLIGGLAVLFSELHILKNKSLYFD